MSLTDEQKLNSLEKFLTGEAAARIGSKLNLSTKQVEDVIREELEKGMALFAALQECDLEDCPCPAHLWDMVPEAAAKLGVGGE